MSFVTESPITITSFGVARKASTPNSNILEFGFLTPTFADSIMSLK